MLCPKCGVAVTSAAAVECPLCGVVLSKASARGGRTQHEGLRNTDPVAKAAKKKRDLPIVTIVARLDSDVFTSQPSRGDIHHGSRLKVNPEMTREDENLARDFGVESVPTVYVIAARSQRPQGVAFAGDPNHYFGALDRLVGRG